MGSTLGVHVRRCVLSRWVSHFYRIFWSGTEEFGYHSLTFALYLDAIVRKVDPKKRSLAQYFDDEFAKPLGKRHICL